MLGVFPRLSVMHTDEHVEGQVYIKEVNYILMLGCLAIVLGFQSEPCRVRGQGLLGRRPGREMRSCTSLERDCLHRLPTAVLAPG
jgi:hypothetical protein